MNSPIPAGSSCLSVLTALVLGLSGCGGGSTSGTATAPAGTTPPVVSTPPAAAAPAATGLWKGTISSDVTGQSPQVFAMVDTSGRALWMTTDGAVWDGQMPLAGGSLEIHLRTHLHEGSQFPDGTHHGSSMLNIESLTHPAMLGRYSGAGDSGRVGFERSPMWDRPASLETVAGSYTRSISNGYTMTLTIGANGQLSGSDTAGCLIHGTVSVADPAHNLYRLQAEVSSCGALNGTYQGLGCLLDADAMHDWTSRMWPVTHGRHMGGGGHMGGQVTIPSGQRNLFMFALANESNALMDALAR